MYEPHPLFSLPSNENILVWRYMDFTKFVSMLSSECLYFTRVDKLGDPFEGSWSAMDQSDLQKYIKARNPALGASLLHAMSDSNRAWTRFTAANCWHMNEYESAAMWKIYLKSNEGIAIQSTCKRLCDSIVDQEAVNVGVVRYIDYDRDRAYSGNVLSPLLCKRKSLEYEREIRAVVMRLPPAEGGHIDLRRETIDHGVGIKIDLRRLIENVHVAPGAPEWVVETVSAVSLRYGHAFAVTRSRIDAQPLF